MKKTISIIAIFVAIILTFFLTGNSYAAALASISTQASSQTVRPGEDVNVTVNFGENLGAAILEFSYDNNIFDYVSVDEGTANDQGDKVRVEFHDTTGGTAPINSMTATFKAKADLTTSNPTEITIVGEGFGNADGSVRYDDITTPMVERLTVEPDYQDYVINLSYTGDIIANEEKDMTLSYSSSMGRYYEHARLEAEATTPTGATVKLTGINTDSNAEQNLILSGWGDPQGYKIGGKDFEQTLNLKGLFSNSGDYTITLKLIDRDDSDKAIAEKAITLAVKDKETVVTPPQEDQTPEAQEPVPETPKEETKPKTLPKTGENIYITMFSLVLGLAGITVLYNKKNRS